MWLRGSTWPIYDVFLGVCVQDNGCSVWDGFQCWNVGLISKPIISSPSSLQIPGSPALLSARICAEVVVDSLSLSHPSHSSTTHSAWHWQPNACCSWPDALRGPAPAWVECSFSARVSHRDLDALLDSGHPWVLLIPARARLCYSSYHLCHLHSQPPWGSLPPQVGGRDDPTSTNWDIMRNPWIRRMPHAKSLSHVRLFVTPWTVAHQAPLSMGFSRQEYWSRLPCSPPGDLPDPVIKPASFMSPGLASRFFTTSATWKGSCSVVSDSLQPHGLQPTRLLYGIFQVRATWEAPKGCCSSPKTTQSIPSEIFLNHS